MGTGENTCVSFFSHSVTKGCFSQICQKLTLCGKEWIVQTNASSDLIFLVFSCIKSISVHKCMFFEALLNQSIILALVGQSLCYFHNPEHQGGKPQIPVLKTLVSHLSDQTNDLPLMRWTL